MRDNRDLYHRRTYWPRSERPELLGEVDFDRPCGNCGYNLRGLPPRAPCPECGSTSGFNLTSEPPPWDVEQRAGAFLKTVALAVFQPRELARALWSLHRLDPLPARRFRRIVLFIAAPALTSIVFGLTLSSIGMRPALLCLPLDAAAIVVWLHAATLAPVAFFRDKVSGKLLQRVEVLAHYASAPLALLPLTLAPLPWTLGLASSGEVLAAAGIHAALLLALLAAGLTCVSWITHEAIDVSRAGAFGLTFAAATAHLGSAAVLLVGVPLAFANLAVKLTGG